MRLLAAEDADDAGINRPRISWTTRNGSLDGRGSQPSPGLLGHCITPDDQATHPSWHGRVTRTTRTQTFGRGRGSRGSRGTHPAGMAADRAVASTWWTHPSGRPRITGADHAHTSFWTARRITRTTRNTSFWTAADFSRGSRAGTPPARPRDHADHAEHILLNGCGSLLPATAPSGRPRITRATRSTSFWTAADHADRTSPDTPRLSA